MTAKLIPVGDWNAARFSPPLSPQILRRWCRDGAVVVVAGKTPPTFHELHSLSLRLYRDQVVNAQALAGHKISDMTSVYRDVRGDEWAKVRS